MKLSRSKWTTYYKKKRHIIIIITVPVRSFSKNLETVVMIDVLIALIYTLTFDLAKSTGTESNYSSDDCRVFHKHLHLNIRLKFKGVDGIYSQKLIHMVLITLFDICTSKKLYFWYLLLKSSSYRLFLSLSLDYHTIFAEINPRCNEKKRYHRRRFPFLERHLLYIYSAIFRPEKLQRVYYWWYFFSGNAIWCMFTAISSAREKNCVNLSGARISCFFFSERHLMSIYSDIFSRKI